MSDWVTCLAVMVFLLLGPVSAHSKDNSDVLVIVDGAGKASVATISQSGRQVIELPVETLKLGEQLKEEINAGGIAQNGPGVPAHLEAFSKAILATIPDLFERRSISVVTDFILPLEMVRRGEVFLGDVAAIAHEFPGNLNRAVTDREGGKLPMSRYVVEAIIGMPKEMSRIDQDIVKVALDLEREIPVELDLGGGVDSFRKALGRDDVSILHIDTHGGPDGQSIQVGRDGAMLAGADIKGTVRAPVILLFGCEGATGRDAFGAALHARGAAAVISPFARFNSFGLTGDPDREHRIYEAFFASLREGQKVGAALVSLRQAALLEGRASPQGASQTRLLFILIGRDDISFAWPPASRQ